MKLSLKAFRVGSDQLCKIIKETIERNTNSVQSNTKNSYADFYFVGKKLISYYIYINAEKVKMGIPNIDLPQGDKTRVKFQNILITDIEEDEMKFINGEGGLINMIINNPQKAYAELCDIAAYTSRCSFANVELELDCGGMV